MATTKIKNPKTSSPISSPAVEFVFVDGELVLGHLPVKR
jgi:hypothetical protein